MELIIKYFLRNRLFNHHHAPALSDEVDQLVIVSEAEDIEQSLKILLRTHLGERTMQEEYGCGTKVGR